MVCPLQMCDPRDHASLRNAESGFTLLDMLITLALSTVITGIAVNELKELDDPLKNASADVQAFVKRVRARAISTTAAYTIVPVNVGRVKAVYADTCADTATTNDSHLILDLPLGASFTDITWRVCFNPRGLPNSNIEIELEDLDGASRTVEVFLGGAIKEI